MIRSAGRLQELEAQYQRDAYQGMTYPEALRRFAALWAEARLLNPDFGNDWMNDIEPDIAVARAVNGLPPTS